MKMFLILFKNFLLLSIFFSLKYVKSDEILCHDNQECLSILIEGKIIFISKNNNNQTINYYDPERNEFRRLGNYQTNSINKYKNILKINDQNEFVIYGLSSENIFYYDIYSINKDFNVSPETNGERRSFQPTVVSQFDAKIIYNTYQLIIFGDMDGKFVTYLVNLNMKNDDNISPYKISMDLIPSITEESYERQNIQCNSLNGQHFFCVFYYKIKSGTENYPMYYINDYYTNHNNINPNNIINICDSQCLNGNIETINNNKYFLCYQEKSGGYFNIICKYFEYNEKVFEEKNDEFTYDIHSYDKFVQNPLILYHYENSIFIIFNYNTPKNVYSYMLILSLNLKINLDLPLMTETSDFSTINFFNDDFYIYHIFTTSSGNMKDTKIIRTELIQCKQSENIILSKEKETHLFDFTEGHKSLNIKFSINENIRLNPARIEYNPSSSPNPDFKFIKGETSGVFDNYYLYYNSNLFSLICQINITVCYELCSDCIPNEIGTDSEHLCRDCLRGYVPKEDKASSTNGFNCYENISLISDYYFEEKEKKFKKCNETCKYCKDSSSCKACKDGYYFKFEKSIQNNTICSTGELTGYYIAHLTDNEKVINSYKTFKETIDTVYKKCYKTCNTCYGEGNEINNNCMTCNNTFKSYFFSPRQCLEDYKTCLDQKSYWEITKNNTIKCVKQCDGSIIYDDDSWQCVQDCTNYVNAEGKYNMYYTLLDCNGKNYCIPIDVCNNIEYFKINHTSKTCMSEIDCNINDFNKVPVFTNPIPEPTTSKIIIVTEPLTTLPIPPTTHPHLTPEQKESDIDSREKIIRIITINQTFSCYNESWLINDYITRLQNLYNSFGENIYLILYLNFTDYNITIYPLDIENFYYDNVIIPNHLGSIYFEPYFPGFIAYEANNSVIILVILLERLCLNSAINELNYYFYIMDERDINNGYFVEGPKDLNLSINEEQFLKVIYPLKDYKNENSTLKPRNCEYLINNIQSFYTKEPNVELYNIEDPFFNDICFQFTSDLQTDMTLNDRRQEYYINKSLCEDNCYLETLLINENDIKSSCLCKFKTNYTSNKNAGINDVIPSISTANANSILCIDKTFKPQNLAKNIVFWVIIILLIFLLVMLLIYIFYGNQTLKQLLHLDSSDNGSDVERSEIISENFKIKENNINNYENKRMIKLNSDGDASSAIKDLKKNISIISDKSNSKNKLNINNKNNKNENNNNNNIQNMSNSSIYNYSENKNNKKSSNKIDIALSNNDNSNPPKKHLKKEGSMTTKAGNEEKDLISNDHSLVKKYQSSEISYDSYKEEKPILIDNLLENGVELENNYINYPKEYEKKLVLNLIKNSIFNKDEEEDEKVEERRNNSECIENNYQPEIRFNYKKKLKLKNKTILKILEGEDLFKEKDSKNRNKNVEDGHLSDNYEENKYNKNKGEPKNEEIEESEYSPNITDNMLSNYNISKKRKSKNKLSKRNVKPDDTGNTNNIINDDTSKSHTKKESILTIYEVKKSENKILSSKKKIPGRLIHSKIGNEESNDENSKDAYGKEEENKKIIKTEEDKDNIKKKKINHKYINNNGIPSQEESNPSSSKFANRSFVSNEDGKVMIKSVDKNKLKSGKKINNKRYNFEEEEEKNGDMTSPDMKKKLKKFKRDLKNKKKEKDNKVEQNNNKDEQKKPEIIEKKSDFEIFNEKVLGSSVSSFVETIVDMKENKRGKDVHFFKFYWRYLKKRELILVSFIDIKDSIPYFVRWSCFVFCLFFLFMLNCLFLFESAIHDRFINKLNGGKNDIKYYFKHEFVFCIYVSLIYIVFKMIIIKLVLNRALKMKKDDKRMMTHSFEKQLTEIELKELKNKRIDYLVNYHIKLIIYFVVLLILAIFFAYISICYSEIFKNSITSILFGFIFSIILSFVLCAFICLIIVGFYKIGKRLRNKCMLSTYVVLSTMY